jgi:uncharacterized protein (DUF2141 family)
MRRAHFLSLSILSFCLLPLALSPAAQSPASGSIAGSIVADDASRQPIVRATVTLAGSALERNVVAITDAAGRFAFADLPPGQFTLTASKPGFLTMAYGQTAAGRGSGAPISLRSGERIDRLVWALPPGGVLIGRVLNERGQPVADVPITAMQYRGAGDERRLVTAACCSRTDAQGGYRLYGLAPGEYLVAALPVDPAAYIYLPEPWTTNSPAVRNVTPAELDWAEKQLSAPTAATEPPSGRAFAHTRRFYPGTPDPTAATPVTIARGEERRGIDFSMTPLPVARFEGHAVGPDGQRLKNTRVSTGGATWTAAEGTFDQRNLVPGRYSLTIRNAGATLWGKLDVDLNGEDRLGLVVRLEPAAAISGRIVFESVSGPAPADFTNVRLPLRPLSTTLDGTRIAPDGTFTIAGIDPGRYRLTPTFAAGRGTPAAPWVLKSVMLNGRDVADMPFEIAVGEQVSGAVVTFTDRATELSGMLLDASGQPAPGFYVAVFSTDPAHWLSGARRAPAPIRAATDGRYRFAGLPPGQYYLAALTSVDQIDLADAALLKQLAASAITIALAEGEKKVQDLKFRR